MRLGCTRLLGVTVLWLVPGTIVLADQAPRQAAPALETSCAVELWGRCFVDYNGDDHTVGYHCFCFESESGGSVAVETDDPPTETQLEAICLDIVMGIGCQMGTPPPETVTCDGTYGTCTVTKYQAVDCRCDGGTIVIEGTDQLIPESAMVNLCEHTVQMCPIGDATGDNDSSDTGDGPTSDTLLDPSDSSLAGRDSLGCGCAASPTPRPIGLGLVVIAGLARRRKTLDDAHLRDRYSETDPERRRTSRTARWTQRREYERLRAAEGTKLPTC